MRLFALTVVLAVGGTTVAFAQSRAVIKAIRDGKHKDNNDSMASMCQSRRNVLTSEERRFEGYQSELAGVEAELGATQRRLDELKRQRDELRRDMAAAERRYRSVNADYQKNCRESDNCDVYDQRADELERQSRTTASAMDAIRVDIRTNRDQTAAMQTRVDQLSREHAAKKCNALVPGETSDADAQRCLEIFMEWNRLQGDLNRQNSRVPDLRARYEQLSNELLAIENRAKGYESYMAKNCSSSARLVKVRQSSSARQNANTIGQELDALVNDITRLRGVRITVNAQ